MRSMNRSSSRASAKNFFLVFFLSSVLALFGITLLPGCTKKTERVGVMNAPLLDDVKTLDPANAYDQVSNEVLPSIYEALYQYAYLDEPYRVTPLLAADLPTFSKDGRKITIPIRTDIRFHDDPAFKETGGKGRAVTASDFIYSFKRLAVPALESSGWWIWDSKIAGINAYRERIAKAVTPEEKKSAFDAPIEGFQAVGPHVLELRFTKPYPQILYTLAMSFTSVVAREVVEAYSDEKGNLLDRHIGTGPFVLKEWRRGQHILLEKNEAYRPEFYPKDGSGSFRTKEYLADSGKLLPLLNGVRFLIFKEEQPLWLNLLQGNLDDARIPKDHYEDAMRSKTELQPKFTDKGYRLHISHTPLYYFVTFNMGDGVVGKNKLLRQAMSAAIDRKEWIRLFTNDRAILATTLLPPGIDGRPENFQPKYGYDPARAKALLAKAGFPGGKGLQKLTFDLRGADSKSRQIGEFFVSQWEKIGIQVEAVYNSFPAFLEKMKKANHQVSYGGWAMDYPDLENAYQILYGKNAAPGPNESNFNDPRFNALYEKIAVMRPGPERSKLARQMEEILSEELPIAVGFYHVEYRMTSKRLLNYRASDIIQNRYKYMRIE